jgi:hypothetical protein
MLNSRSAGLVTERKNGPAAVGELPTLSA